MPALAAAAPYIGLATTAVNAYSQQQAGKAQENQAKISAIQDEHEANAAQAISQREAIQERKKARYLRSRALAVAGASGAGAGDGQISDILADIDTEGEMNAMNILYSGNERARVLRSGAAAKRGEGRGYRSAGYGRSAATAFQGASDFYQSGAATDLYNRGKTFFQKYGGERAGSYGSGNGFGNAAANFAATPTDDWEN